MSSDNLNPSTFLAKQQAGLNQNSEAWLILSRTPGLGPRRLQKLLSILGAPENILSASHQQLLNIVSIPKKTLQFLQYPDIKAIRTDMEWLDGPSNNLISILDPLYPPLLQQIPDPPAVLYCCGNPLLLTQAQLAIVGSRNPDHYGQTSAFEFAKHLSLNGIVITSGMALGIDGAAHKGALAAAGDTIAVAATGLDRIYPARHRELAQNIVKNGLIISEQTLGTPPIAHQFPRRNRIISGLSLGTFVVQAALQSGSLITARLALEQNREVFALPGSIHNPLSKGCNKLIKEGAKLVESTQDILIELAPQLQSLLESSNLSINLNTKQQLGSDQSQQSDQSLSDKPLTDQRLTNRQLTNQQRELLAIIGYEPSSIDTLVERSEWDSHVVASVALELELLGLLRSSAGIYHRT